jgi:uncharacterized protein YndB with AHSA1/START domain
MTTLSSSATQTGTASTSSTDRIERSILIKASRERVWRALSSADEFGAWFGADLRGQHFQPGQRARGQMTIPGHTEHFFDVVVERVEPQDLFSFHWHPYAFDKAVDYSKETPTLVTFTLQDAPGGAVLLTVVESGFDKVPARRRSEAFEMHGRGWTAQLDNVARYAGSN